MFFFYRYRHTFWNSIVCNLLNINDHIVKFLRKKTYWRRLVHLFFNFNFINTSVNIQLTN